MCVGMCVTAWVWASEDNSEESVLPSYHVGTQRSNLGHEAWWQAPLLAEPSHWPRPNFLIECEKKGATLSDVCRVAKLFLPGPGVPAGHQERVQMNKL